MNKLLRTAGALGLACTSCFGKANGDLAAKGTGDISRPLAARGAPDERQRAACGAGAPTAAGEAALYRRPFLAEVQPDSARIVLATKQPQDVVVDVSLPDGTPVGSVQATPDGTTTGQLQHQSITLLRGLSADTLYCYSVRGLTDSTKQVDTIASALKGHHCFKEVKQGKVEKTKDGNKVSFRLDIQVQCPDQPQAGEG